MNIQDARQAAPGLADRSLAPGPLHQAFGPKMWLGMDLSSWLRLLVRNRFDIGLGYLPSVPFITVACLSNSVLRLLQQGIWGRRIRQTNIREAPLFVIGHWRAGTTWLHELLSLDERHAYPTTYQCLAPHHFLLTERRFSRLFRFLLPSRRPMDEMALGFERPQEDEIALCNLGIPSHYWTIAFPDRAPQCREYLDLESLDSRALDRWKKAMLQFLRQVTLRNPKRLVLKSPTHTYRIQVLLDLFPDARFVHIVRDPYVVFASTVRMWQAIYAKHSLQHSSLEHLQEYVMENFLRLHRKLEDARPRLGSSRFCEICYEDLVKDPIETLRSIYEQLELGDFESVLPRLKHYVQQTAGYTPNSYTLTPEERETISRRWGDVIRRYGYAEIRQGPEA